LDGASARQSKQDNGVRTFRFIALQRGAWACGRRFLWWSGRKWSERLWHLPRWRPSAHTAALAV